VSQSPPRLLLETRALEHQHSGRNGASGDAFSLGPFALEVYGGEFLSVIGPNGSGKTTLLRLLGGLAVPARGTVHLEGADLRAMNVRQRAQRIAVVRQDAPLVFPVTVEEFVLQGRYAYRDRFGFDKEDDRRTARSAMEATQICSLAQRRMDEISGGERQRVVLARALAQQPRVLLLDEPTANLDLSYQVELLRMIRRLATDRGLGVVAVMHDVNLASEFSDYILLIRAGKLCRYGTPHEVLTAGVLEDVYGVPIRVDWNPQSGRPHVTVMVTAALTSTPAGAGA
jgi:iron complex transport system ATP-binding protein